MRACRIYDVTERFVEGKNDNSYQDSNSDYQNPNDSVFHTYSKERPLYLNLSDNMSTV